MEIQSWYHSRHQSGVKQFVSDVLVSFQQLGFISLFKLFTSVYHLRPRIKDPT